LNIYIQKLYDADKLVVGYTKGKLLKNGQQIEK